MRADVSAEELQLKLEELNDVDTVSVSFDESSSSSSLRVFRVTFLDSVQPSSLLELGEIQFCQYDTTLEVISSTVTEGFSDFVPEIEIVKTSASSALGGFFELRYGYKGDFTKAAPNHILDNVITVTAVSGAHTFYSSNDLLHIVGRGTRVRINDEEVTVVDIIDNRTASFFPYLTHSAESSTLFVEDTLLGVVNVISNDTVMTSMDYSNELRTGDQVLLTVFDASTFSVISNVLEVAHINEFTISFTKDLNLGEISYGYDLLLYRQQARVVAFDTSSTSFATALSSLATVGTVDVTRYGPDYHGGMIWKITFTSVTSPTYCDNNSCVKSYAYSSSSVDLSVSGLTSEFDYLAGTYVSDSFINGRRSYFRADGGPFHILYNGSAWTILSFEEVVYSSELTYSVLPEFDQNIIVGTTNTTTLLNGQNAEVYVYKERNVFMPNVMSPPVTRLLSEKVLEVQSIELTSSDGILIGGFSVDFNNSGVPVYVRADEIAKDFRTKLTSLPTVGDVLVTRAIRESSIGSFLGFNWTITFLSNEGDLPPLKVDLSPSFGLVATGSNISISVAELVKGVSPAVVTSVGPLKDGSSVQIVVSASNDGGLGLPSSLSQNEGEGILPYSVLLSSVPESPILISATARSGSEISVIFAHDDYNQIDQYILEFTSDTFSGFQNCSREFGLQIVNTVGNDTNGYFRISFQGYTSSLIPWGISAKEMSDILNNFPTIQDVTVTVTSVTSPNFGSGFDFRIFLNSAVGSLQAGDFEVDLSLLSSESLSHSFYYEIITDDTVCLPPDYGAVMFYDDCSLLSQTESAAHQVGFVNLIHE
jgi:hypothetical protein